MNFSELVVQRRSVKSYDPEKSIDDDELRELFEEVVLSPSSFNLQHWTFVAVRDADIKSRVKEAAWGQQHVEDCSVVFLVCGRLDAYNDAARIFSKAPQKIRDKVVPMIHNFYDGNESLIRDEAIRSASLAAMTLMYAAKNRGYGTCPIIGFDPDEIVKLFRLSPNYIPVMMVVLGTQKSEPRPRDYRRPIEEVVRLNALDGPGLTTQ